MATPLPLPKLDPTESGGCKSHQPPAPLPLSCVLCRQRKVKCDRRFPCSNCVKHQAPCVPTTQVRRRRRRFPERELLERLRRYEALLVQHKVKFEPLHPDPVGEGKDSPEDPYDSNDELAESAIPDRPSPSASPKSEGVFEVKNIWRAMNQEFRLPSNRGRPADTPNEATVKKAWSEIFNSYDPILFGSQEAPEDVSSLHPESVHIFRLWQVYLDNINPLLKVTHTPSLQKRIIEAASSVDCMSRPVEALMFGIYCISIRSLSEEDCQDLFGSPKDALFTKYRFGCQQALLNCKFLQTDEHDCLVALYLYLMSIRAGTNPAALSSILGIAIRISQRMGMDNEAVNSRYPTLEAEMRRRLWWSLVHFDARIGELAGYKAALLGPTWDCKIPLNANDSELWAEMKGPPPIQGRITDALFAVVQGELGDFVRHASFHLDFTLPSLKPIARATPEGTNLVSLGRRLEEQYIKFCDPENPVHFMTIWTTRACLAKCSLLDHYAKHYNSSVADQTETQLDAALSHALAMLRCDTQIVASPLTKGYVWYYINYFPFIAYLQVAQDIRRRPFSKQVEEMWDVMSANFDARFSSMSLSHKPIFRVFADVVLGAWDGIEKSYHQAGKPVVLPKIVLNVRQSLAELAGSKDNDGGEQLYNVLDVNINDFLLPVPMALGSNGLLYGMGEQGHRAATGPMLYQNMPGQAPLSVNMNNFGWPQMS